MNLVEFSPNRMFIRIIKARLKQIEAHLKPGESVRMFYGGVFGVLKVKNIEPESPEFLRLLTVDEDESDSIIVCPVSQCSIQFVKFIPSNEKERGEERPLIGYGQPQSH